MIYGLSTLGAVHTLISLVAVASGAYALIRDKRITLNNTVGKVYLSTTALTCLTGFGIFHHGGFGPGHVLGIITLLVMIVAMAGERYLSFGQRLSPYVSTVAYSATFFFHMIPGFTETATRLPLGAPLASGPDDPALKNAIAGAAVLFLCGAALQVRSLWRTRASLPPPVLKPSSTAA